MAKKSRLLLILLIYWILCEFCDAKLDTRRELLFFFDKVQVKGSLDVFIKPGKRNGEAKIYADAEIIDLVRLHVSERTLFIDANNTFTVRRRLPFLKLSAERKFPVEVVVSIDRLEEIEVHENSNLTCTNLSGSNIKVFSSSNGLIHFENLLCENLQVRHEGAGNIFLRGRKITKLQAHLHGSGSFQAGDLPVDEAIISHHGNGLVEISPERWLDARIRKNGNLLLHEKPLRMVVERTGSGEIKQLDLNSTQTTP